LKDCLAFTDDLCYSRAFVLWGLWSFTPLQKRDFDCKHSRDRETGEAARLAITSARVKLASSFDCSSSSKQRRMV